jgi:hypothetical protein
MERQEHVTHLLVTDRITVRVEAGRRRGLQISPHGLRVQPELGGHPFLRTPLPHSRSTSLSSIIVTSRNIDASWSGMLPSTGDVYRAVRRGGKGFEKPGPEGGKGFEKLQSRGGKGFEKVVRKGSLGFENRHDRDQKFTKSFDDVFQAEGIEMVRVPFRAPQANGVAERFVRTVRTECLDWLLVLNSQHLERAVAAFIEHYNRHRPHRGLGLRPPQPPSLSVPCSTDARIVRRDRLGGSFTSIFEPRDRISEPYTHFLMEK